MNRSVIYTLICIFLYTSICSANSYLRFKSGKPQLSLRYRYGHYKIWTNYFKKWKNFKVHLGNARKYKPLVQSILKRHGIPIDLHYLALIESGYNIHIKSRANAVGPWQFIASTARRYGLRVDKYVDERRNIHKSTEAAAQYLKDLYNIFGDWNLALCAFNAGEYRIINAIRKGNTRDYIKLSKKRLIPKETILYIPKLVAAYNLDKRFTPKINNISKIKEARRFFDTKVVKLRYSFNAIKLAKKLGISYTTFRKYNPDLKRVYIKNSRRRPIRIILPRNRYRNLANKDKNNKRHYKYIVKKGDNLSLIAKKFKISVKSLIAYNDLDSSKIFPLQAIIIPKR